jgi:hypothetical protein
MGMKQATDRQDQSFEVNWDALWSNLPRTPEERNRAYTRAVASVLLTIHGAGNLRSPTADRSRN